MNDCPRSRTDLRIGIAAIMLVALAGCTTDGTTDPALQNLLSASGTTIVSLISSVAQGIATAAIDFLKPLFTAGGLALFV